MASTFKLKGISALKDIQDGDKIEAEVEGVQDGKILLIKLDGQVHALTARCTHYGAPLKNGILTPDARLTCPWHGACFNVTTGDVEDAPALNALRKFEVSEQNGAVYVKGTEKSITESGRVPITSCAVSANEKVVIVGGGSGAFGVIETLREHGFKGQINLISKEPNLPLDRTKLSKALIPDADKILLRPKEWYSAVSVTSISDEVTSVDFRDKTVTTTSGKSYPYTKLVLASGGTPRRLPLPGFKDLGNIFVLRTVVDVQNILTAVDQKNKNIVVVGSSFIGMEVANALAKENNVTVIGMESAPLERVMGAQVGHVFQSNLEKSGVKFYLGASVDKAAPSAADATKVGSVHLKDGTALPADLVILGVGISPATEYLRDNPAVSLEKDGSLKTDESFAVGGFNNDVYAVGDIATYPYHGPGGVGKGGTLNYVRIEHWDVAQNSGRNVGRTLANDLSSSPGQIKPKPFIPIFWSALGGAPLRYCGNTVGGYDDVILKGEPENSKFVAFYTQGDIVVAVATMGMDPINSKSAELMRRGKMPGKQDILKGVDVLSLDLPAHVRM